VSRFDLNAKAPEPQLTRNPNQDSLGLAAARDLASRRLGDASLYGPRTSEWWTGKAPHQVAGWIASEAGGHLTSLPLLNLDKTCTRESVLAYFENTWTLTEQLFASLQGEATFYMQPYHQLRHPLMFYYGHVAALYINKLRLAGLIKQPVNAYFEALFETGVDEMRWDDLSQSATQWPAVAEVRAYRRQVYETVRGVIETHAGLLDHHASLPEDTPLWALAMCFEHERIHLETSSVLIRELPQPLVAQPEGWVEPHSSVPESDVFSPTAGVDYPHNALVRVAAGNVTLGKPREVASFGWDNEYGEATRAVPAFHASQYKISNGEFLEFVRCGGYREQRHWSADGWGWRTFRNAKWPAFWSSVGPSNLHQYRLRLTHSLVPMPWSWPAEVNAHEATAFCTWRAEQDARAEGGDTAGAKYRLVSEVEHMRIRQVCAPEATSAATREDRVLSASGADFSSEGVNLNLAHGSPAPVDESHRQAVADGRAPPPFGDAMGNVWEWCADDFHPLDGFRVHPLYDDFSTPCFDGAHNIIMGGSWASTGDEASAYSRFHFRPHFFQHAGLRLVAEGADTTAGGASPVVKLSKSGIPTEDLSGAPPPPPTSPLTGGAPDATEGTGYESRKLLDEYMMLHFGKSSDVVPFETLPKEWLAFPQRCAQLVDKWANRLDLPKGRALDIGCAVGGSSFELGKTYKSVVGVDLSASFIQAAQHIQAHGAVPYFRRDQGELGETRMADIDAHDQRRQGGAIAAAEATGDIRFERADACALPRELGSFDACLLANLLCRLPSPQACLDQFGGTDGLVKPGGLAVVVSPYTWMEEHTPKDTWLGGYTAADGTKVYSDATLRATFAANGFDLLDEEDMPLLIREHSRKYQLIVSHAMIFRRRVDS